ncbi:31775_t:CDS:2, partial [Racocetra persica]
SEKKRIVQMQSNALNTQKSVYINYDDDEYSSENNSNISSNEMFEENTVMDEEEVKDIINKLNKFKQKKKPKKPLVYVENFKDKSSKESSLNNEYSQILELEE